jgi:PBP1b-binding outer membrane lipoprotein LpoB
MKKVYLLVAAGLIFVGCAGNKPKPSATEKIKQNVTETVKKVTDKCELQKTKCIAKCKLEHLNKDWKYKACISKCYAVYGACKTGKAVKKGYEKTKELINK